MYTLSASTVGALALLPAMAVTALATAILVTRSFLFTRLREWST